LQQDDPDSLDSGVTYGAGGYQIAFATQRPLYSFRPDDPNRQLPDLAAGPPAVAPDGKRVTVHIRPGIRYSPPVKREVRASDVKYAIERGFLPSVGNPYASVYFRDLRGRPAFQKRRTAGIAGITTPDSRTIVFRLTKPSGRLLAGALGLPLTAPVPPEYARRFDRHNPSEYGLHQVATGPYMVESDRSGKVTGYAPHRRIVLVRNPDWRRATDPRPAKLDRIEVKIGADPNVATRQILTGQSEVNGDFPPPPAQLKRAQALGQVRPVPEGGVSFLALNTQIAPFDDPNIRKAVLAAFDRVQARRVRGGAISGPIASHFLPPDTPGFAEAGGGRGTGVDFLRAPRGDLGVARRYLRKAGYPSGRFRGASIALVGARGGTAQSVAEVAQAQLAKLGFDVDLRLVSTQTAYRLCATPARRIPACSGGTWIKDFNDPEAMLRALFEGAAIQPSGNPNWSQLRVPRIDAAIRRAARVVDPSARARAWARIDRMVVAEAPAVPLVWESFPYVWSKNVNPVVNLGHAGFDFTYTSLK
jgi:peptide/nickel transport system substrate-binding protein